ncbi:hypothetical protein NDN08_007625 [Rhodosorus marinus]|uniref:GPN-loop GTPase 3 n=1 Tax=Rhodosorus marinus TaxID=101924 RepID=A0AAV8UYD8_9RHOD|nr:hypothetical protein NDN08_007625 [Rhodosorus marinus]
MVRFGQLVIGPAGSGKSTYCSQLQKYCEDVNRTIHVVNLDPAAENFDYKLSVDMRELISIDDVAEEMKYGPNGGLVFCMEYLLDNFEWLEEQLEDFVDGDYICFDCPGQIELYTHFSVMRKMVEMLQRLDFRLCALYFVDSQFMADTAKFFGGCTTALSAMVQLQITHINVLSKMDLVRAVDRRRIDSFTHPDYDSLAAELNTQVDKKFSGLNQALAALLEEYNMVSFVPLDYNEEDAVENLLLQIDIALNYDETVDPKMPSDDEVMDPEEAL